MSPRKASALRFAILILVPFLNSCTDMPVRRAPASDSKIQTHYLKIQYKEKWLGLRVGIEEPKSIPIGDILYIHGLGDRLDNHEPLYDEWVRNGFRVISFDLPSHGENEGDYNDINNFGFSDLADLIRRVELDTKSGDPSRPLFLSGWSTGGLLIVRMMQKHEDRLLSRKVAGLILFAPGVSVHKLPWTFGDGWGEITTESLTHDPAPPRHGSITPDSPFWSHLIFSFSPKLIGSSILSQAAFPNQIRTLILLAGDQEDHYAKSHVIKSWISERNEERESLNAEPILGIQCPQARHELDNELPEYGGTEVRELSARFARAVVNQQFIHDLSSSICTPINVE